MHDQDAWIDEVLSTSLRDPFGVLGMHNAGEGVVIRCFLPWASGVAVIDRGTGQVVLQLTRLRAEGIFSGTYKGRFDYRLRASTANGDIDLEDVYRFPPILSGKDVELLNTGTHLQAYDKLGAHLLELDGVEGTGFAVWAPNARSVSVVGPFNDWDGRRNPMRKHPSCGIWDLFLPHLPGGEIYKYEIHDSQGNQLPLKADPFATETERPPHTASRIPSGKRHIWRDAPWMERRAAANSLQAPISIYEVHLGSWRRRFEEKGRQLSYLELAQELVPYVVDLGFTHIELLPISEHPFEGSWGYQPISLFAPTCRYGTPEEFSVFVDTCHEAGLAVWLDWVPGHFPSDAHGLSFFDGTHLYEHADPRQGLHQEWNTLVFNFGRREVANYLIANALFWLDRFHIDGLRVDAVASMLYLDYSRKEGEWVPNAFGGRENLEAVDFLKRLNTSVFDRAPGTTTAAEESTAWAKVSAPTYLGGLGFGYKWNMGWMHDTLEYMACDPVFRRYHQNKLTFGPYYAFSENFILPLSHDEVVYGKKSLLGRMPGDRWQQFANLRAYYGFMWAHPGKKLLFMGGEFAQEREWSHDGALDWPQLDDPMHRGVHTLVRDLNHLYRSIGALHLNDVSAQGFAWVDASDTDQSIISFLRYGNDREDVVLAVCNFTPVPHYRYRLGVPLAGYWRECLNTDASIYGGSGLGNFGGVATAPSASHGHGQSLELVLPPLSTAIFRYEREV